jgi:hypothetical protein
MLQQLSNLLYPLMNNCHPILNQNIQDARTTSYMEMDTVKHQLILVSSYEHVTCSIIVTSIIQCRLPLGSSSSRVVLLPDFTLRPSLSPSPPPTPPAAGGDLAAVSSACLPPRPPHFLTSPVACPPAFSPSLLAPAAPPPPDPPPATSPPPDPPPITLPRLLPRRQPCPTDLLHHPGGRRCCLPAVPPTPHHRRQSGSHPGPSSRSTGRGRGFCSGL